MTSNEDWKAAWRPLIDTIGQGADDDHINWGIDGVEAGAIRRYLEPLEFDCALHYDRDVARAHGYDDIIAPYTGLSPFFTPPIWRPGTTLFTSAERNAQPDIKSLRPPLPPEAPPFTGYFATDMELDFLRPVAVGERLGRRPVKLIACQVKETRMGRGAFVTFETVTVSDKGDTVSRMRFVLFCYNPHPKEDGETTEKRT